MKMKKIKKCPLCDNPRRNGRNVKYCLYHSDILMKISGRDRTREMIRIRDNYQCQNPKCGLIWEIGMRKFDVHHKKDKDGSMTKGYDKAKLSPYLITLCHKCHMNLPSERSKMMKAKGSRKLAVNR